ncbi:glycoside hydrolase family 36 protein [Streptomyces shenzhenensis]|uniref:glycoside hydrolase family 36 protein n=1 Tax=Streptomyces shenzhenensis TaxID=943815 RepID=UPI00286812B1|nr:alpha-galactosidase [Streptomyces shenzhenensis]
MALVEIFTAAEQRERTSQAYVRSAVGGRLRHTGRTVESTPLGRSLTVSQHDPVSGLTVRTTLTRPEGLRVLRITSVVENRSSVPVILTAVSTASLGFGAHEDDLDHVLLAAADSEWLAENRWREQSLRSRLPALSLPVHGQDGRGHFGLTSHGAWSTGEHLPAGVLTDVRTRQSVAWQLETGGAWHWDLAQARDGGVLSLLGPTDLEHQFAHELLPGRSFETIPVAVAVSDEGRDGALAQLTRYRRLLRETRPADLALPVVYNDFMNTLMGQPSTAALKPLIDSAADAGAEYFCIDAGWFADPSIGDWWSTVGEWREAPGRFDSGLKELTDRIHSRGMKSGLWLEPEVVGVHSPAASAIPEEAFFRRFGQRVVEHERYHLDFRHPAARAHADEAVDRVVAEFGVSYLKLDYNINPGAGTEWRATTAGDGLLGHVRSLRAWLVDVQRRHPDLLIENCSSGAMRADYSLLSVTHLQSTSDQQDFRLYPPVSASAPATIVPEQCGNWAYPHADMSDEETAFTLVSGLAGRLYLSGFLHTLSDRQTELLHSAVSIHKEIRAELATSVPFWPLGLPGWDDPVICLGLRTPTDTLLFVWDRAEDASSFVVPGLTGQVGQLFPPRLDPWEVTAVSGGLRLSGRPGHSARVFRVRRGE